MKEILFISINRHQFSYFSKISSTLNKKENQSTAIHAGRSIFFHPKHPINKKTKEAIYSSANLRLSTYKKTRKKPTRLLSHYLYFHYLIIGHIRYYQALSLLNKKTPRAVVLWNGSKWHQSIIREICQGMNIPTIYFENGGLPATTTIDPKGVNELNSLPRDPEFYRNHAIQYQHRDPVKLDVREYKKVRVDKTATRDAKRYIFIPFQVDSDTQILLHSPHLEDMTQLWSCLDQATRYLQDDLVFVIKEHPSSANDYSHLHSKNPKILFSTESTQELIERAEQVWTINSSVGLEAILLDKPVLVLGNAFYKIRGIAEGIETLHDIKNFLDAPPVYDHELRQQFIHYLRDTYYIPGNWRKGEREHLQMAAERVLALLDE